MKGVFTNTDSGRRLSRRRAAGGDLPARAAGRCRGQRDGHRPGRDPPPQHDRRLAIPLPDAGDRQVRQRRSRRPASPRRSRSPTGPASPRASRNPPSRGKLRGIGLCTYVEACGLAPSRIVQSLGARAGIFESATVRVHATGDVTVLIGTHNHGQGHETTFAQIVSEQLEHPRRQDRDRVRRHRQGPVRPRHLRLALARRRRHGAGQGDRQDHRSRARRSPRTCSRRAMATSCSRTGNFAVAGTDRRKSFGDVVGAAYGLVNFPIDILEPGMEEQAFYDPVNFTYPGGAHIAEVEIDPDTGVGRPRLLRRGRRHRHRDQPDDRRRPAPRRHRPGRRPGAVRELRLRRRQRPDAVGLVHGLRHAAGRQPAQHEDRHPLDALHPHQLRA